LGVLRQEPLVLGRSFLRMTHLKSPAILADRRAFCTLPFTEKMPRPAGRGPFWQKRASKGGAQVFTVWYNSHKAAFAPKCPAAFPAAVRQPGKRLPLPARLCRARQPGTHTAGRVRAALPARRTGLHNARGHWAAEGNAP